MVLAGGTINSLPVNKTRQFAAQSPVVEISLLPTGILTGSIDLNEDKLPFKGAFVSPSVGGAGFILETNGQMDGFLIQAQP